MEEGKLYITLYTIPQAACDQKKMKWTDVAALLKNQMEHIFHEALVFKHVEFVTDEWFADMNAQSLLENGTVNFHFVMINGEVVCSEKKVNISKIKRFAESKINSLNID